MHFQTVGTWLEEGEVRERAQNDVIRTNHFLKGQVYIRNHIALWSHFWLMKLSGTQVKSDAVRYALAPASEQEGA